MVWGGNSFCHRTNLQQQNHPENFKYLYINIYVIWEYLIINNDNIITCCGNNISFSNESNSFEVREQGKTPETPKIKIYVNIILWIKKTFEQQSEITFDYIISIQLIVH